MPKLFNTFLILSTENRCDPYVFILVGIRQTCDISFNTSYNNTTCNEIVSNHCVKRVYIHAENYKFAPWAIVSLYIIYINMFVFIHAICFSVDIYSDIRYEYYAKYIKRNNYIVLTTYVKLCICNIHFYFMYFAWVISTMQYYYILQCMGFVDICRELTVSS